MSLSIGAAGANMGPRGAIEKFGEDAEAHAFDARIAVRLFGYLRPYWQRMIAAIVLILASSALTLAAPYLVKVAIDQCIAQNDTVGLTQIALLFAGAFLGQARDGEAASVGLVSNLAAIAPLDEDDDATAAEHAEAEPADQGVDDVAAHAERHLDIRLVQ